MTAHFIANYLKFDIHYLTLLTASGDIRNLVRTINGLPDDYSGKCDILFNDYDPIVSHRNWIILHTLLQPEIPIHAAVNLAIHLMYSAALSPEANAHLYRSITILYGQALVDDKQPITQRQLATRGEGMLCMVAPTEDLQQFLKMPLSTYGYKDAMKNMRSSLLHHSRVDYRDRHLASLTPGHRMAWTRYKESGVLGPYSAETKHLTEPNRFGLRCSSCIIYIERKLILRLMFDADGEWLTLDNANPLHGWDVSAVIAAGKRHEINVNDIYGCLFFYLKDEFEEFSRRIERFNINIQLTQFDARILPKMAPLMKQFSEGCFDRIETSNLADYIGPAEVIDICAPLLNRRNKHAALLMNFVNWHIRQPGAIFEMSEKAMEDSPDLLKKTAAALVTSSPHCHL